MSLDGPFADDFTLGVSLPAAPSITIDSGLAAGYQAITGDPLRLPLSAVDSTAVTGGDARLANPGLVLQVAIGQSTVATRRVIANLFYRDVALHRQVHIGDTITTTVTPVAVKLTRPGSRARRAKVLLRIETVDQQQRLVARFERLALLPCRDPDGVDERGEIGGPTLDRPLDDYLPFVPSDWKLGVFPGHYTGIGDSVADPLADTVSGALELVRLTQNQAAAHRDPTRGQDGSRLVYGGHAIGLAQASLARTARGVATVVGWRSCDHLAPVFEGDVLDFHVKELDRVQLDDAAALVGFRVVAAARDRTEVLDWRPVALVNTDSNTSGATS
ncbi:acyl dehydratase [Saccharopolyspora terrae]|uniref:Acyl dehydratase n=1 Tax=Saccharopolyspora terrae TaxID=2530384 RepID=A0A4R4VKC0_9PSEU|nr:acyl dehydratase [Saccharopolyspora terrae]TDD03333.1 acyl dehydratase [Saccharopolyspora terrae]